MNKVKALVEDCVPLSIFNSNMLTIVTTDASYYALKSVLQQEHSFASTALTAKEFNHSTDEKEVLAGLWVNETWHALLRGRCFTLYTDHEALMTLLSTQGIRREAMRIAHSAARLFL